MKKKKKRQQDDIYTGDILSDDIMRKIAAIIDEEFTAEIARYESMDVEIPYEHDMAMLEMARQCDHDIRIRKRHALYRKAMRVASVFLVFMVIMGGIGMSASEAFRMRIFGLFENSEDGAVVFRTNTDAEILEGWTDYWYPTYLPEGYYLLAAEQNGPDSRMLFDSANEESLRLYQVNEDASTAVDIDTNMYEELYVGEYAVYVFHDEIENTSYAIWLTDNSVIQMHSSTLQDSDTILSIVEGMKYVE